jgi:hypothetical protein
LIFLSGSPNATIKNNIFYDPLSRYVSIGDELSRIGLDVGYNNIFRSDGQTPEGTPYPHDLWQVNPQFVDPGANDFHLLPDSPAIDAGIMLDSVDDDFDGFPRPLGSGFDIGAYEYLYNGINTDPSTVHNNDTLIIKITFATNGHL